MAGERLRTRGSIGSRELRMGDLDLGPTYLRWDYSRIQSLRFHDTLPPVMGRRVRASGNICEGTVVLTLQIRTTDTEPDNALIARVRDIDKDPRVDIKLERCGDAHVYSVSMMRIQSKDEPTAKRIVDRAARILLEAKEISQGLAGEDTKQLMAQLSKPDSTD